jgi:hypothetical protein
MMLAVLAHDMAVNVLASRNDASRCVHDDARGKNRFDREREKPRDVECAVRLLS